MKIHIGVLDGVYHENSEPVLVVDVPNLGLFHSKMEEGVRYIELREEHLILLAEIVVDEINDLAYASGATC